jgi:predicted nuclease of restriction endonuclease-like (RecB) superfamily
MASQSPSAGTYAGLLISIKERIQTAQVRASLAVNRELVLLYWGIGREILARQSEEGWGSRVVERLAKAIIYLAK